MNKIKTILTISFSVLCFQVQAETVDDVRARLFASTGGNVTQEATDFYREQIIADPNGSPYSVSVDGYTGEWGGYPAMDMSNTKFQQPTIKTFDWSYKLQMQQN